MVADRFDFSELDEITPEDVADAETETERRGGMLAAILLGLWVWNRARVQWERDGQALSRSQELGSLEELSDQQASRYLRLLSNLGAGSIGLAEFAGAMGVQLTRSHLMAAALGKGGFEELNDYDRRTLDAFLAREREFLAGLIERMDAGQTDGLTSAHLRMYARHVNTSFYEARRSAMEENGRTEERRILNPAEHCADCVDYAAQDWQPIGTLPPPGDGSQCLSNCKCDMVFR